jgi:hypothetical protein
MIGSSEGGFRSRGEKKRAEKKNKERMTGEGSPIG